MFSPTYHEGTILTIYMSHWHRAIEGIHIFNSLIYFSNVMGLWMAILLRVLEHMVGCFGQYFSLYRAVFRLSREEPKQLGQAMACLSSGSGFEPRLRRKSSQS